MSPDDYVASVPAHLRAELWRYARHYPRQLLLPLAFLVVCGAVGMIRLVRFVRDPLSLPDRGTSIVGFLMFALFTASKFIARWRQLRRHFFLGCANPAVVVSTDPVLVAVYTDLSKGGPPYPAIKILKMPLGCAGDPPPKPGDQRVAVATYGGPMDGTPCWTDFDPLPACAATGNRDVLAALKSRIEPQEWLDLHDGLSQLPQPFKPGLYPIRTVPQQRFTTVISAN